MDRKIIKSLPQNPGVYFFKVGETPIYIGKAKNLKSRVSTYFDLHLAIKTQKMVEEATNFSFIKVISELEALLLEAKLINQYQPKYNSISKDDKHPLYIAITNDEFPRVIAVRKEVVTYQAMLTQFGPFPASTTVRQVLRMLRRIFPYSDHKVGKRGCLYSHIGLCNPCPSEVINVKSRELKSAKRRIYLKNIRSIKTILSGRVNNVKRDLEKQMQSLSQNERFEEAAEIREKLRRLEYITQPIIPTEAYIENPNLTEDIKDIEIAELLDILNSNMQPKIKDLSRIECFDIAHLAGTNPTASMVTFINGEAEKSEYRHFKIRQTKGQSDYDSMREVASRRLRQSWDKPDLIIVDGGMGQVKAFTNIIKNIPIVGIAKNPDRLIIGTTKFRLSGASLNLVQKLRNEAHRFARRYHHKLLSRSLM